MNEEQARSAILKLRDKRDRQIVTTKQRHTVELEDIQRDFEKRLAKVYRDYHVSQVIDTSKPIEVIE